MPFISSGFKCGGASSAASKGFVKIMAQIAHVFPCSEHLSSQTCVIDGCRLLDFQGAAKIINSAPGMVQMRFISVSLFPVFFHSQNPLTVSPALARRSNNLGANTTSHLVTGTL